MSLKAKFIVLIIASILCFKTYADPVTNFLHSLVVHEPVKVFLNAESLDNKCKSTALTSDQNFCRAYISGVIDTLTANSELKKIADIKCYENEYPNISLNQLQKITVKYIDENPKILNVTASTIVIVAYLSNFPIPHECLRN